MATEYRKFYLIPGQQAPKGSTSQGMPDGGIVWIGDEWTATEIKSHVMSAEEKVEYSLALKYNEIETQFEITFEDFKDDIKLAARKIAIKDNIDSVVNS